MDESYPPTSVPRGFSNPHHFTICGLQNIWLLNGYHEIDTKYGKSTSYLDIEQLEKLISYCLVSLSRPLIGREMHFLRMHLYAPRDAPCVINARHPDQIPVTLELLEVMENEYGGYRAVPQYVDETIRRLFLDNIYPGISIEAIANMIPELKRQIESREDNAEHFVFKYENGRWG